MSYKPNCFLRLHLRYKDTPFFYIIKILSWFSAAVDFHIFFGYRFTKPYFYLTKYYGVDNIFECASDETSYHCSRIIQYVYYKAEREIGKEFLVYFIMSMSKESIYKVIPPRLIWWRRGESMYNCEIKVSFERIYDRHGTKAVIDAFRDLADIVDKVNEMFEIRLIPYAVLDPIKGVHFDAYIYVPSDEKTTERIARMIKELLIKRGYVPEEDFEIWYQCITL